MNTLKKINKKDIDDIAALTPTQEGAWDFVAETNEMLRTMLRWDMVKKPVQIILKKHRVQAIFHDFPGRGKKSFAFPWSGCSENNNTPGRRSDFLFQD